MKQPNCSYTINLQYRWDEDKHRWVAELRYSQQRNGKQYGGQVVEELTSNGNYDAFFAALRRRVKRQISILWT